MTEIDISNYDKIKALVKRYFSLSDESNRRFSKSLESPPMVPAIQELFNGSPDYRISFDLETEHLEDFDEAWQEFSVSFNSFIGEYSVTYSNFLKNKVTVNKNQTKLKKAAVSYYTSDEGMAYAIEITSDWDIRSKIQRTSFGIKKEVWNYSIEEFTDTFGDNSYRFFSEKEARDFLKKQVEIAIMRKFERIGTMKVSNEKKLKIVLSRNFADWFLASTAERSWTSCLSLESSYEGAYWSGLPGTIVDPNRILIYVTDGETKEYQGIKTERYMQRTWAVIDDEGVFHNLKWYDSKKVSNKTIKEVTGINLRLNSGKEFRSYSSFEPLWFQNDISCFIYSDNSLLSEYDDDAGIYILGADSSDMCIINENREIIFDCVWYLDNSDIELSSGLSTLIELDVTLAERQDGAGSKCCDECGCSIDNDDYSHNGTIYCEDCYYEIYTECDHCNSIVYRDEAHTDENGDTFCDDCQQHYILIDHTWYSKENVFKEFSPDGEYDITIDGRNYSYNFIVDEPNEDDNLVFVKPLDMYFPEEMCEWIACENSWWTKELIDDWNDERQYKLSFGIRIDENFFDFLINNMNMNMIKDNNYCIRNMARSYNLSTWSSSENINNLSYIISNYNS